MKLFAALLVLSSASSAFAFSPTDMSRVETELKAIRAQHKMCLEKANGETTEDYPSMRELALHCGESEDTLEKVAVITYSIANPQSRCASWTAIAIRAEQ